jgi:hypothetical protein
VRVVYSVGYQSLEADEVKASVYKGAFGCWVVDKGSSVHRNFSDWTSAMKFAARLEETQEQWEERGCASMLDIVRRGEDRRYTERRCKTPAAAVAHEASQVSAKVYNRSRQAKETPCK